MIKGLAGKRILIVNVNWIGDVIFSTPFIRTIRNAFPDAYIACLIHPRCAQMLMGSPAIDEIIVYDEEGEHKSLVGKFKLILHLRKMRFDTAFLLHRSFTKALLVFLAGIRERVGYPTKNRSFLLSMAVSLPDENLHKVEYFLGLARGYGIKKCETSYEFFVQDSDRAGIRRFLNDNGISEKDRLVVLCPGGNWDPKRWPRENFASLADMLYERLGVKIVLSGAKKDSMLVKDISGAMRNKPVVSCGLTTLKGLGALLERADLVIANDSGPMHLAVAMKSRVIALFGPTSPELTGPYGVGSYSVIWKNKECETPCYDVMCADNRCMKLITVEEVFKESEKMLAQSTPHKTQGAQNVDDR